MGVLRVPGALLKCSDLAFEKPSVSTMDLDTLLSPFFFEARCTAFPGSLFKPR